MFTDPPLHHHDHINDHVQGAQTILIRPHLSKVGVSSGYLEFHGSCRVIYNCTSTMANSLRESFRRGKNSQPRSPKCLSSFSFGRFSIYDLILRPLTFPDPVLPVSTDLRNQIEFWLTTLGVCDGLFPSQLTWANYAMVGCLFDVGPTASAPCMYHSDYRV